MKSETKQAGIKIGNQNLYCWHCTIVGRFCPPIVLSRDKQLFSPCRWTTKTELLSPISVQVNIMPALIHVGRWWEYCCLHPGQKCPWIGKKCPWIVLSTGICPPIVQWKQLFMIDFSWCFLSIIGGLYPRINIYWIDCFYI